MSEIEVLARRRATVAIVGRANVGKSTLFNRLVGRRQAIVHDVPGVTRDRIFGTRRIDAEVSVDIIDTGGLTFGDDALDLDSQVMLAVEESDVLLHVVDGGAGLVAADEEVAARLRPYGRPTILVVNKADLSRAEAQSYEFYRISGSEPILVSAEHGLGVDPLLERLENELPTQETDEGRMSGVPAVAIVGRPNVGKSSVLNRIVGDDRSLVSEIAGTTRDPVDTRVRFDGETYILVDTAGIRRRSQVSGVAEGLAVMMARRQIERAEIAVLVIDASAGVTGGDLTIAGSVFELGRACVVLFNKWDLVGEQEREKLEQSWERLAEILRSPRRANVSAKSARNLGRVFPLVVETLAESRVAVSTARLNEIVQAAVSRHHVPTYKGRPWKALYVSQVSSSPPTFLLFANRTLPQKSTFRRYLENSIRAELGLKGVPVRLVVRRRTREPGARRAREA